MVALQGPVFCPTIRSKQESICTYPTVTLGFQGGCRGQGKVVFRKKQPRMPRTVICSFTPSSNANNSMDDEGYINSSVVEAVVIETFSNALLIRMQDGKDFYWVHNNPHAGHVHDYTQHHVVLLKMEDGSNLLLPIIVLKKPSVLPAIRDVYIVQPTSSQFIKEIFEKTRHSVKLVRVSKRVHDTHFAQLFTEKVDDETEGRWFGLRSSEAIDIAISWKVPIQVNKDLVFKDSLRMCDKKESQRLENKKALRMLKNSVKKFVGDNFHLACLFVISCLFDWGLDIVKEICKDCLQLLPPTFDRLSSWAATRWIKPNFIYFSRVIDPPKMLLKFPK